MFRAVTRYPSLTRAMSDDPASAPVMVDGLEVVDEQTVLLAPVDATRSAASRRRKRVDHAVG